MPEPLPKEYLGDAVYLDDDGYHMVLTTNDGLSETNTICIEPALIPQLKRYIERFKKIRE